jgi:hypothetical protein
MPSQLPTAFVPLGQPAEMERKAIIVECGIVAEAYLDSGCQGVFPIDYPNPSGIDGKLFIGVWRNYTTQAILA